jgi:hypothetical protein
MGKSESDPWNDVTAARIPVGSLGALARLRAVEGVRVAMVEDAAWVTWPLRSPAVVPHLRPIAGAEFFVRRDGVSFRFGTTVPTSAGPPTEPGCPLDAVLIPARVEPSLPTVRIAATTVVLVRGGAPHKATALACSVASLRDWADIAPAHEIEAVRAARNGGRAILIGDRLPAIADGVRFWGIRVFCPVGFRPEPELDEPLLAAAAGLEAEEKLFLTESGAELVPGSAFEPLTRAGIRLALSHVSRVS